MWRDTLVRWQGVLLSLVVLAATAWLAATGQLSLYIHPRYVLFTVIMTAVAAVFVVGATVLATTRHGAGDHHDHHDEHDHDAFAGAPGGARGRIAGSVAAVGSVVVIAVALVSLLVVPPATLTSATAASREMNAGAALAGDEFVSVGGDYRNFSVKDWSSLLTQVSAASFYEGKSVDVTGFVSADSADPDNVFFVSRFIVTCCAVDAQPVGVPVYQPGWADELEPDQWVRVTGPFVGNESSGVPVVVQPASVDPVDQPADPYVY